MAGPALRRADVDRAFALRAARALLEEAQESLAIQRCPCGLPHADRMLRDAVRAQGIAIARLLEVVEDLAREDRR